jgi:hypothetical protein
MLASHRSNAIGELPALRRWESGILPEEQPQQVTRLHDAFPPATVPRE